MASLTEISKITTRLLLHEPFYGHFLLGMPKAISKTQTKTACVSLFNNQIIKLSVNPDFWESLNETHQYGLIKHEILHVALRHLNMMSDYTNKSVFNIAADLVVNQYIKYTQLPDDAIKLETFAYFGPVYGITLEPLKSTRYYYDQLMRAIQKDPLIPLAEYEAIHGPVSKLDDLLDAENQNQEKHKQWKEFDSLSEAEKKVMEYQLYNQVKNVMARLKNGSQIAGDLPAHLVEYLKGFLEEYTPQVDWKRELKRFTSSSTSTYLKNTVRRPSKRYGTTPGIKVKRRQRVLVALDTSGSVPIKDIQLFFSELHHIWKRGAEVIITECDAALNKTYPYEGKPPESVTGRGGTNFNPPIELANKKILPDCIVYFTDGYERPPTIRSRCPVLWVISPKGIDDKSETWNKLIGKKVKMT